MSVSSIISLFYHAGGFAGSLAVRIKAVLDVYRARRRRPRPLGKKRRNARSVYELAYSTTSSSAKDSLWPGAAYPSKRGSQK